MFAVIDVSRYNSKWNTGNAELTEEGNATERRTLSDAFTYCDAIVWKHALCDNVDNEAC